MIWSCKLLISWFNFNPTFIDAHISLGLILLDLNKLDESANVFKMALKLKPEDGNLHRHLSSVTKYSEKNSHIRDMEKIISNNKITQEQQIQIFCAGKGLWGY